MKKFSYLALVAAIAPFYLGLAPWAQAANAKPTISVLCMEADRGVILHAENERVKRPPASMIKLMLMLLVVEGYERGDWTPDREITVTRISEGMGGTQVYLNAGETWKLSHLLTATTVASANDAAMAIAEGLWGGETAYLEVANARAKALGMEDTVIHGVHGLPPDRGEAFDVTTAHDMALLARACVDKPLIMELAGRKEFQFRPTDSTKFNTNKLLWRMEDCDGLKTGFINAAGFCIAASAKRDGRRLICIVMGSPSKYGRFQLAEDTMNRYFDDYASVRLLAKGDSIGVSVPLERGRVDQADVVPSNDVVLDIPRHLASSLEITAQHPATLQAPLGKGAEVGSLEVSLNGTALYSGPLVLSEDAPSKGWYLAIKDGKAKWMGLEEASTN